MLPNTMKALLPFLIAVLAPFRKLVRGLLDKHVSPIVRHALTVAAGWLGAHGLVDDEMALRIVSAQDIVMAIVFGALALLWSYAEKKLGSEALKEKVVGAAPILFLCLSLASIIPACSSIRSVSDPLVNRAKAIGLGVRCVITGEEVCLCVGVQDTGDPSREPTGNPK